MLNYDHNHKDISDLNIFIYTFASMETIYYHIMMTANKCTSTGGRCRVPVTGTRYQVPGTRLHFSIFLYVHLIHLHGAG